MLQHGAPHNCRNKVDTTLAVMRQMTLARPAAHVPAKLVAGMQDWKSQNYRDLIAGGAVTARPGVLRLMDEALHAGLKLAVCSAATKESVVFTLTNLLGQERFDSLDCFLAGDDVPRKKPDPIIYTKAAGVLSTSWLSGSAV